jgi:hypothetical protein
MEVTFKGDQDSYRVLEPMMMMMMISKKTASHPRYSM